MCTLSKPAQIASLKISYMLLFLFLFSCKEKEEINLPLTLPEYGLPLSTWQIIGPFKDENKKDFLNTDNLKAFGFEEQTITYADYVHISKPSSNSLFKNELHTSANSLTNFNAFLGLTNENTIKGNIYAGCIIHCPADMKVRLNISTNDRSKVWLNNQLILKFAKATFFTLYEDFILIDLKKGENFLLIKVNKGWSGWEMITRLENNDDKAMERHKNVFRLQFNHNFIDKNVTGDIKNIALNKNLPFGKYKIIGYDGAKSLFEEAVTDKGWNKNISGFKNGIYMFKLYTPLDTFSQTIYKGHIIDTTKILLSHINKLISNENDKNDVAALAFRVNHLLKPKNRGEGAIEIIVWQRKMVSLFSQLQLIYNNLIHHQDPFRHTAGYHIKSYVSHIDGNIQYYVLHVPATYNRNKKYPLVVLLPVVMRKLPYLESYRVATFAYNECQDLADKYNVIVFEPNCRLYDRYNANAIEETDYFEALVALKRDFNIDKDKIYLTGTCLGGWHALSLATKYPDQFAGVAMVSPIISIPDYGIEGHKQNESINKLKNLIHTPIFSIHRILDSHAPVSQSDTLNQLALKEGLKNFKYWRIPDVTPKYYGEEYIQDIFKFFKNIPPLKTPNEIYLSANKLKYAKSYWLRFTGISPSKTGNVAAFIKKDTLRINTNNILSYSIDLNHLPYTHNNPLTVIENGQPIYHQVPKDSILHFHENVKKQGLKKNENSEGPLSEVFSKGFILVVGTAGNVEERKGLASLANTIDKAWYDMYDAHCIIKKDHELKPGEIANHHLLLLGNASSNTIISRFSNKIPLKVLKDKVNISGHEVTGGALGFYMVYPNPLNHSRYVGIIGYNNPCCISWGKEAIDPSVSNISTYGWYDYKIWDTSEPEESLAHGYFDQDWK